MKKEMIFLAVFMLISSVPLWSQGGYSYVYNYDDDPYDNYRDGYRYNDYDRYSPRNLDYYYSVMNRSDRKCLNDLEDKLIGRRRKALEDGYLSAWDRRRIREVERSIDRLLSKYPNARRYDRRGSNNSYNRYRSTRVTSGPRCR